MSIVEIRWYKAKPGRRDELAALMDAEVIPLMESFGIAVDGSYRDLNDETGYLWIRRFDDQEHKDRASAAVYGSTQWTDDLHGRVLAVMDDPSTAVVTVVAPTGAA